MHLEMLDNNRIEILKKLDSIDFVKKCFLGGGTAVSLQLGLRESFDFDFFTYEHFNINELEATLREYFSQLEVIQKYERKSTLDVYINNVKVSFLEYSYPKIAESINLNGFNNIKLFSNVDLACMKCVAIVQRGTKKDFFDLYHLLNELNIGSESLIAILNEKFNDKELLKALTFAIGFFDDAEDEKLPKVYVKYSWEEIKKFYVRLQQRLDKLI